MISGWNPPHGSRTIAALILLMLMASSASGRVVRFAAGHPVTLQEEQWIQEDRSWLAGTALRVSTPLPASPFSTDADSVALLRTWAQQEAAEDDSLGRARPVWSRLAERWHRRGYIDARVTGRDTLLLNPGSRYHLAALEVGGEDFPGRQRLLDGWMPRPGDPYVPDAFESATEAILRGAGELGYPFARWVNRDLKVDRAQGTVVLEAMLLPGRPAVIGPITASVSRPRAARFLARATGLNPGAPFRHSDVQRAVDRLLSRDLYTRVDTPRLYLTTSRDTVGIHFPVMEKTKVNRLQVVLGLSRTEGEEANRLSGEVDLRLPNLAGSGRSLGVGWRDDGNRKSWFGFNYLEPLIFGTPLDAEILLDNEVLRDEYTRLRLDNRWRIPVVALWGVEFGVGWDRTTYPTGSLAHTGRLRGRAAVLHHRGDPRRSGWAGLFALETAYRSSSLRAEEEEGGSAPQVGAAIRQQILSGDLGGEWWLSGTVSLFGRGSYRQQTGDTREVPLSEQFRFGGANSLRGYREDEFNGTRAAWGGLEVRMGRAGGSRLYTFYDLGYFEFSALDPLPDDPERRSLKSGWPRGYGLGIFARTPGGDISLAVGFPGTVDFDRAKLHVTLMESF